ncbi:hypothetical protein ASPBRDRAFT_229615 [Aspergillus brasiliensis CBS 101740]|uniref:Uncharacterized protein n=1 Tax=Aspergillus brasiliensis (strain CBS 101740 / IMI 381727 / IBT 21946) TaxID=767769 RepID=A0A1L9UZN5_ASPBC|nr:hypothetical protein ASPBRDRAFT_229615 [Aspergillus brasiliensis CBS 101740]
MSHVVSIPSSRLLILLPPLSSSSSFLYHLPICTQPPSPSSFPPSSIYIHLCLLIYVYNISIYCLSTWISYTLSSSLSLSFFIPSTPFLFLMSCLTQFLLIDIDQWKEHMLTEVESSRRPMRVMDANNVF